MQTLIGALCLLAAFGYWLYFLWYLSWPTACGRVEGIRSGALMLPSTPCVKRHRLINYSYQYQGKLHHSSRQSLLVPYGLGPDYSLHQPVRVKVCPQILNLCCLKRPLFELGCMLCINLLALPTGLFYWLGLYH